MKKIKIFSVLIFVILGSFYIKAQNYSIIVDDVNALIGEEFDISINTSEITSGDNIVAYQFDLSYDETICEYIEYDLEGTLSENDVMIEVNANTPGLLKVVVIKTIPEFSGFGSLIKLRFNGISIGNSLMEISNFYFNASQVGNIGNGNVTISRENTITVDDVSALIDDEFSISINTTEILPDDNIVAYQFDLSYDETICEYVEYDLASTMSENDVMIEVNENTPGLLNVVVIKTIPEFSGFGSLIRLRFNAISCGNSLMEISNFYFNASQVNIIENGNVKIGTENTLTVGNTNTFVGDNFSTGVSISQIPGVCGISNYQFDLSYDYEHIQYNNFSLTGTIDPSASVNIDNSTPGELIITVENSSLISGTGDLLFLDFTILTVDNSFIQITDFQSNNSIAVYYVDGLVTSVLPFGNVDGIDGINALDAFLVLQNSVELSTEEWGVSNPWEEWRIDAADVNNDETLNSMDASLILQYIVSLIDEFPVESGSKKNGEVNQVEVKYENNTLVFYSATPVYGFDITSVEGVQTASLGKPEKIGDDWLIASNTQNGKFKVGMATAVPVENDFLQIPLSDANSALAFNVLINGQESVINWAGITSLNDELIKQNIIVFPNPVRNILTLKGVEPNSEISIYSLKGELLKQLKLENSTVNFEDLAPNNYLIKVKGKKATFSKMIIKE